MTHSHIPGSGHIEHERAAFCLPCRRVLEYAKRIPWNDEGDDWDDVEALETWIEEDKPVLSERSVDAGNERSKGAGDQ